MELPEYHTVIDKDGHPQSVMIGWDDFMEMKAVLKEAGYLIDDSLPNEESKKEVENKEPLIIADKTADHVEGGDFQSLRDLGITLPDAIRKRVSSEAEEELEEEETEIRLGRRIR